MKKVIYGVLLIAVFGLTACGNDKKETTASSISNSSEQNQDIVALSNEQKDTIINKLNSEVNKKISKAFLNHNLEMYSSDGQIPAETIYSESSSTDGLTSDLKFKTSSNKNSLSITIQTFNTLEDLEASLTNLKTSDQHVSKNENILSIMYSDPSNDNSKQNNVTFAKYSSIFERLTLTPKANTVQKTTEISQIESSVEAQKEESEASIQAQFEEEQRKADEINAQLQKEVDAENARVEQAWQEQQAENARAEAEAERAWQEQQAINEAENKRIQELDKANGY